jgi:thiosulfate/3-mercaptopyruvate sulfurtransferase
MKAILLLLAALTLAQTQTADPWTAADVMQPKDLAGRLAAHDKTPIIYVGFPVLYRGGPHIAGALLAGPCSKPAGLEDLKKAVANLPHDSELVIYCGCCPFVKCPNIRPAYRALHELGFTKIRVVVIDTNLHTDWVEKGYPVSNE